MARFEMWPWDLSKNQWLAGCVLLTACGLAKAWSLSINAAGTRVFLHVGNGVSNGTLNQINLVQATVPATQLGTGTPVAMESNSTQSQSLYGDGYTTCPSPNQQVLIGASYRANGGGNQGALLSVNAPSALTSAAGDTIPIQQISWSVSAPGSAVPNVIPAGTFNGGQQTLTTVPRNTYFENCHTFSYANTALRAAGTYNARVTYTISTP